MGSGIGWTAPDDAKTENRLLNLLLLCSNQLSGSGLPATLQGPPGVKVRLCISAGACAGSLTLPLALVDFISVRDHALMSDLGHRLSAEAGRSAPRADCGAPAAGASDAHLPPIAGIR